MFVRRKLFVHLILFTKKNIDYLRCITNFKISSREDR